MGVYVVGWLGSEKLLGNVEEFWIPHAHNEPSDFKMRHLLAFVILEVVCPDMEMNSENIMTHDIMLFANN